MKQTYLILTAVLAVIVLSAGTAYATEEPSFEEQHKDKPFIVLSHAFSLELKEDWSYVMKATKRLKILKEEAKEMGEVTIPYDKGREKITLFSASTTAPDGKKYTYSKAQDLKVFADYPLYSDSMVRVVTLPQVTVGSILDTDITTFVKHELIKNTFWVEAYIGSGDTPIKELKLSYTFPKKLNIQYREFNLKNKPVITENGSKITYAWDLKNLYEEPEREECIPPPTPESAENGVEFSSIPAWSDVSGWYYAACQRNLKITPQIEETARKIIGSLSSTKDKVKAILEYIQDNFRYVSMSFGDNALEPHPTDEVFKNKYGDCKDLSLLCKAMLEACGIESYMVLMNTEYSISDPQHDLPIPTLFDHVILLVKDKDGDFYVDPLLKGYDIGEYPLVYQFAYTFTITGDGGKFDRLPVFDESKTYAKQHIINGINSDGSAVIEDKAIWTLDDSINMRLRMKAATEEEKKKMEEWFFSTIAPDGEVTKYHLGNLDSKYGAITSCIRYKNNGEYPVSDGMIVINLAGFSRLSYFTEKERKNAIFFPTNSLEEEVNVYKIPEGFRVISVPENLSLDIGISDFKRTYEKKPGEIIVSETKRTRRAGLPANDYAKVKEFYDKLPAKTTQRIVLKRIKPWYQELRDALCRFKEKK